MGWCSDRYMYLCNADSFITYYLRHQNARVRSAIHQVVCLCKVIICMEETNVDLAIRLPRKVYAAAHQQFRKLFGYDSCIG